MDVIPGPVAAALKYLTSKHIGLPRARVFLPKVLILGTYAPGQALIDSLCDPNAYTPPPAVVVGENGPTGTTSREKH